MGVIFIGGVHGVGKSTRCQQFSQATGVPWFTASALIKAEMHSAIVTDMKAVADPVGNQELLIRAVGNVLTAKSIILLDGHFTLFTSEGCIVSIEVGVFKQLKVTAIIILRDEPSAICDRLRQRDGHDWSIPELISHQMAEINHAQMVATELCIPMRLIDTPDISGFAKAVEAMLR